MRAASARSGKLSPLREEIKQRNLDRFGSPIKKYRLRAGLTAEELARALGVSLGSVRNWECGLARPDPEVLLRLFSVLDVEPNEFFGLKGVGALLTGAERKLVRDYRSLDASAREDLEAIAAGMSAGAYRRRVVGALRSMSVVPDWGRCAAAGSGVDWSEDHPEREDVVLYQSRFTAGADEIITVSGDSMEPQFQDGDRVLVRYCDALQDGDIGIFFVPGIGGVIKQKAYDRLHSLNRAYDDIFPYEDGARVVGRVLGKVLPGMEPGREDLDLYWRAREEAEAHPAWFA